MYTNENIIEIHRPQINQVKEMFEISSNFRRPLEVLREAISNSYDANAKTLYISAYLNEENKLIIKFVDNGGGMSKETLIKNFWGLGYTDKDKNSSEYIGEKSHGTLIYLRSEKIIVETFHSSGAFRSIAENPLRKLSENEIFEYSIEPIPNPDGKTGTEITLIGFNQNVADDFKHEKMRDYIYWFTKLGSFENQLIDYGFASKDFTVYLRGIDYEFGTENSFEKCPIGHIFPKPTPDIIKLIKEKREKFFQYYVKKWSGIKTIRVIDSDLTEKEIEYQYVIYFEGDAIKKTYNDALKSDGKTGKKPLYRVADRYGIYLAKDFIPFQRINDWLPRMGKGSGTYNTSLHGFINCQDIQLTSDRNAMASTNPRLENELKKSIQELLKTIDKELKQKDTGVYYFKENIQSILEILDNAKEQEENKNGTSGNENPGSHGDDKDYSSPLSNRNISKSGGYQNGEDNSQENKGPNPAINTGDDSNVDDTDKRLYEDRIKKIKNKRYYEISGYNQIHLDNSRMYECNYKRKIYEPFNEAEVYSVFMQLYALFPNLFPFTILDYSTHKGIDLLVQFNHKINNPAINDKIFYLELKHTFYGKGFNHSFHSIAFIVCWDIDNKILVNSKVMNLKGEEAFFKIDNVEGKNRYYLEQLDNPIKIQVLPLKRIIEEELGLKFKR
jgi:hypothetical protein